MKKFLASSLLFLGACAQQPTNTTDIDASSVSRSVRMSSSAVAIGTGDITSQTVAYATIDGKQIQGYMAMPSGSGSFPGLVLIHEWWGLNDDIRSLADDFARQGYAALAVDMYEGESTTDQNKARELSGGVQNNMERAADNLRQATAFLRAQPAVKDDAIASVGWCFGGGWAYQMAKNDYGLDATVMYYGLFNPHDDLSHMTTDIIGHFGEEDMNIKVDDVRAFEATLKTTNGDHEIYIYPNAGHGFANRQNPQAYNPEAAALAWQRTLDFLRRNVK